MTLYRLNKDTGRAERVGNVENFGVGESMPSALAHQSGTIEEQFAHVVLSNIFATVYLESEFATVPVPPPEFEFATVPVPLPPMEEAFAEISIPAPVMVAISTYFPFRTTRTSHLYFTYMTTEGDRSGSIGPFNLGITEGPGGTYVQGLETIGDTLYALIVETFTGEHIARIYSVSFLGAATLVATPTARNVVLWHGIAGDGTNVYVSGTFDGHNPLDSNFDSSALFTVNLSTGAATRVSNIRNWGRGAILAGVTTDGRSVYAFFHIVELTTNSRGDLFGIGGYGIFGGNGLFQIDKTSGRVTGQVISGNAFGNSPEGVTFVGNRTFVTAQGSNTILIDGNPDDILQSDTLFEVRDGSAVALRSIAANNVSIRDTHISYPNRSLLSPSSPTDSIGWAGTMYAIRNLTSGPFLSTIDPDTYAVTSVGTITGIHSVRGSRTFVLDATRNGNTIYILAGTQIVTSTSRTNDFALYTLNLSTRVATRVGNSSQFGVNLSQVDGISFFNNTLYMSGIIPGETLNSRMGMYTLNTRTGVATALGQVANVRLDAGSLASDGVILYLAGDQALYSIDVLSGAGDRIGTESNYEVARAFGIVSPGPIEVADGTLYISGNIRLGTRTRTFIGAVNRSTSSILVLHTYRSTLFIGTFIYMPPGIGT